MRFDVGVDCGAWEHQDGGDAHHHCTGEVALPGPNDVCACPCHILWEVAVYLADMAPAESCT